MATSPGPRLSLPERYSVVRHIANGGMASVWEANDELLGRSVAVKVLSPQFAADDAARRRFTREARAAARLSTHPHVVTVYDAGEHDGQAFLVMALYPGGTVADRIKAGPVDRADALDWLEDAAGALDLAHGEGVVHRDVKPANLLLDAGDRVAVADFGIATAAWETSMTSTGLVLGTLAYLAPEQRAGSVATPASDRYALGLVARELLTGGRPQTEATPTVLPAAAEVALMHATAEDPERRPPTCAALVAELEAALGEEDRTAATQPLAPRPRALATPIPPVGEPTAAHAAHPSAPPTSRPARAATPPPRRVAPAPAALAADGPPPRRSSSAKALVALAVVALLVGIGAALAASQGGSGDPDARASPQTTEREPRTTTGERETSTSTSTPAPAPGPEPEPEPAPKAKPKPKADPEPTAPAPAAATKSRAALVAQNNAAYLRTKRDPAGQVAPLQEAVDGLCTDTSDMNCAYALFNLASALRLSGRAGEAIPLLERRLAISDFKTGTVRAALAAARRDAG